MINRLRASIRPHYDTIAALCVRDYGLVVSTGLLICGLCWYVGHPWIAGIAAVTKILVEVGFQALFRGVGPFGKLSKDNVLMSALALQVFSVVTISIPALFVAADPSLAMKVTGLMFLMGAQIYITNSWLRVPVFLFAMLLPTVAMLGLGFFALFSTDPFASSTFEWIIAFLALLTVVYCSIDTLRQHFKTQSDLFQTQAQSAARLAQLEDSHRYDALTGLLNRAAFDDALEVMLKDRAHISGEVAVFMVDLDSFKPINDTYSHEAGDEVLIEIANRLRAAAGQSGVVGRLGGDEFICAMKDLDSTDDIAAFASQIEGEIARPIKWSNRALSVVASIGAASTITAQTSGVSGLCSAADQAMFAAKSTYGSGPVIYDADLFAPRMSPCDRQHLVRSLSDNSLRPYYQPKVHLPTGKIIGFEALARWEYSEKDIRVPSGFIEQIEELGLQGGFMMSMATQVIRDINTLLKAGYDPGQVSLNIAEVTLATVTGRQELEQLVKDNPQAAQHLTLEITEDVFIARAAEAIQASIASFRALGVRISLDDFGTGFASFNHLRQLDFDELKIDTSFVEGLGHDAQAEVLVRGLLEIASGLGVGVIAEGVETEEQSQMLINMGCHMVQGFLFYGAVPLADAMVALAAQEVADPEPTA